jgi:hypothetical protein
VTYLHAMIVERWEVVYRMTGAAEWEAYIATIRAQRLIEQLWKAVGAFPTA